jgi:CRISPR-associated protein Cmr2
MTNENRIDKIFRKIGDNNLALLLVSIGPVQEFIAEARKTRDLWAGSYLLSKVTFEAMTPVLDVNGVEVILMPDIAESALYKRWFVDTGQVNKSIPRNPATMTYASLPNHFLAIIPDDKVEDITNLDSHGG